MSFVLLCLLPFNLAVRSQWIAADVNGATEKFPEVKTPAIEMCKKIKLNRD